MSEVALDIGLARNLVKEIAGECWDGKADMIDRVHDAIRALNPKTHFTRRRVRAFWHREAAGVRYHEMVELASVAASIKNSRDRVEQARKSHAEYISRIARMATALAVSDEEFHRDAIEVFSRVARRPDDRAITYAAAERADAACDGDAPRGTLGAGDRAR